MPTLLMSTQAPPLASGSLHLPVSMASTAVPAGVKWSWAYRILRAPGYVPTRGAMLKRDPRVGDLALVRIEDIGEHERIVTRDNERLRLYPGDLVAGVFGNRYATDAFEGIVDGLDDLTLLTAGGMIGTPKSRHRQMSRGTRVSFEGYLLDAQGSVMNLKSHAFRVKGPLHALPPVITVVGTGMNAGKTTTSVKLIKALASQGRRVAACKLTGSVSNRDQDEMRSAAAIKVLDFSDYGFPSTYLAERHELLALFDTMMNDLAPAQADVIVMEIADGILQRETDMLLREPRLRHASAGLILAADNALAASFAVDRLGGMGHSVISVSGCITSSPLCTREFQNLRPGVPVTASLGAATELGQVVGAYLDRREGL